MNKARLFWPLAATIVLADCASKRVAETALQPGTSKQVIGEFVRFTLGYNKGVAFGLSVGNNARPLLIAISGRYTRGSDRVLSAMNGFNHHLVKPCDPRKIIELLGALVPPAARR